MEPHPDIRRLERLERLARRMDAAFRVPIINRRVGFDSIIGLIPGVGDAAAMAPAAWIVLESHRMGAPKSLLAQQAVNIGIDAIIGTIPLVGDLFDVGWKANLRNVELLRGHLERRSADATPVGDGALSSHHPPARGGR